MNGNPTTLIMAERGPRHTGRSPHTALFETRERASRARRRSLLEGCERQIRMLVQAGGILLSLAAETNHIALSLFCSFALYKYSLCVYVHHLCLIRIQLKTLRIAPGNEVSGALFVCRDDLWDISR